MNEQEELKKLRALLEEKNHEIEKLDREMKKLSHEVKKREKAIKKQRILIDNLTQALLQARKKQFGRSSEKVSNLEQLSLFESVDELVNALFKEQKKIAVGSHKRNPRKAGVREDMLSKLPKEVVEYVIPSEEKCPKCSNDLVVIGKSMYVLKLSLFQLS